MVIQPATHISNLPKDYTPQPDDVLVADGWAEIVADGVEQKQLEPLQVVALIVRTSNGLGFKVYWGNNFDHVSRIAAHGRKVRVEAVARAYFPVLEDYPFVVT